MPLVFAVELPMGPRKRVGSVPAWVAGARASGAIGTFGGAPYGATKRVMGAPAMSPADAFGRCQWDY
eukprot:92653-Pyramimonas_sp.AAC.1